MATDSQCRHLFGIQGKIIGYIKFIYSSLYLAEIIFLAFVEAFFFHDGAASNQRLPAPLAEKELTCKDDRRIKKLNILIAKMW